MKVEKASAGKGNYRVATREDIPAIVALLADDTLGSARESVTEPLDRAYYDAFDAIRTDPANELLVATLGDRVVATLQLTITPSLSDRGSKRATIESVRTASDLRGQGIGSEFVSWAMDRAKAHGCRMVQLSSHATRIDAQRFYEKLGFVRSHIGMKKKL